MKKNGFIASSLLYGMLALFLVIMLSTLGIFASSKLSMDKLKQKALNDVDVDVLDKIKKMNNGLSTYGAGLYEDAIDGGRYIYRGLNPANYITFNGEKSGWRIISMEADGTVKIVKVNSIGNMSWDNGGARPQSQSTYCVRAYDKGCNAWAKTFDLRSNISEFATSLVDGKYTQYSITGGISEEVKYTGTVTDNASLNKYLNNTYYNNLSATSKNQIVSHDFKVSSPGNKDDAEGIVLNVEQEGYYIWKGNIGLINVTDYMRSTTENTCTNFKDSSNVSKCEQNNWLKTGDDYWTLSPTAAAEADGVWIISNAGQLNFSNPAEKKSVHPVVFLKSNLKFSGYGTYNSPYKILSD